MSNGILGIFAHPDDEGSSAGTLARYAARGFPVYVACATRGDGADAKIKDPSLATPETLGAVRSQELACACEKLGIQPPIFLGLQDGEVDQAPVEETGQAIGRLIRELRPLVVITHGPEGGYGHPDHIAVSALTTLGYALAGDQSIDLGLPAWSPAKLYYTAMPRSFLERVPAFRTRRAEIRGRQLGFVGVPDDQITTEIDVGEWLPIKQQALSCHRTQFEIDPQTGQVKLWSSGLSEPERRQLFSHERFVLARNGAGSPELNGKEADLLAGIGQTDHK
jgi:N-acetyl-1-D-myo-inositol-2-amino-2-deoxy-alpha-D-glucopyranoside deacetylase